MNEYYPVMGIIGIIILIIIKAEISKAKSAINNLNEVYIRKRAEEEKDKDTLLLAELIDKPESYIFAIDVIITTISVVCGILYYMFVFNEISMFCADVGMKYNFDIFVHIIGVIILVICVALFGSLIPKKIALRNPEKRAYKTIGFMMFLMKVLRPMTIFLQFMMNTSIRLVGIDPNELNNNVTEDEIISMVNEGREQGVFEANEVEMISNVMEFDEKEVKDVMTHRKNVIAVSSDMAVDDVLKFMLTENYSRYPVYEDELDNIIGILHVKDVARHFVSNKNNDISLKELMRKPYFVPETQNIDVLLNNMQANKCHMAIVIDEYGQTAGIVAFEDVIEEIVGNILDEYDEDEKNIVRQANGNYLMKGMANLDEVVSTLNIEISNSEYETLNGLLVSLLQRIPKDGEKVTVNYMGYNFEIVDVRNKIIRFVRVKKII